MNLLSVCDRSLEPLRGGTYRPIYQDLQTVREQVAAELEALDGDEQG